MFDLTCGNLPNVTPITPDPGLVERGRGFPVRLAREPLVIRELVVGDHHVAHKRPRNGSRRVPPHPLGADRVQRHHQRGVIDFFEPHPVNFMHTPFVT